MSNRRYLIAILLFLAPGAYSDRGQIEIGDWLFVGAQIVGCGTKQRFVEVGKVSESGTVTFFENVAIIAEGKTAAEVAMALTDEVEQRQRSRPKTIQVRRIRNTNAELATRLMLKVWHERNRDCQSEPSHEGFQDWQYEGTIARQPPHTKPLHVAYHV